MRLLCVDCSDFTLVLGSNSSAVVAAADTLEQRVRSQPTFNNIVPNIERFDSPSALSDARSASPARAAQLWSAVQLDDGDTVRVRADFLSLQALVAASSNRLASRYAAAHYCDAAAALYRARLNRRVELTAKPFPTPKNTYVIVSTEQVAPIVIVLFVMFSTPVVMGVVVAVSTGEQERGALLLPLCSHNLRRAITGFVGVLAHVFTLRAGLLSLARARLADHSTAVAHRAGCCADYTMRNSRFSRRHAARLLLCARCVGHFVWLCCRR